MRPSDPPRSALCRVGSLQITEKYYKRNKTQSRIKSCTLLTCLSLLPTFLLRVGYTVSIARQHAMHAERDTVLPILSVCTSVCLSVCLSVCPMSVLCQTKTSGHIVALFGIMAGASFQFFLASPPLQNSPRGSLDTNGWEFYFYKYRLLCRKRYEIGP